MKLPRDVSGRTLVVALGRMGYAESRQTASHVRLTTEVGGQHHVTVPWHDPIKIGTLNTILRQVAARAGLSRDELMQRLEL